MQETGAAARNVALLLAVAEQPRKGEQQVPTRMACIRGLHREVRHKEDVHVVDELLRNALTANRRCSEPHPRKRFASRQLTTPPDGVFDAEPVREQMQRRLAAPFSLCRSAGAKVLHLSPSAKVAVVPIDRLAEIALLDAVRRVEPTSFQD